MKKKPQKKFASRTAFIGGLFIFWLALIGARAGYLQIYRGAWLSHKAADQYEQELTVQGKRGTIYDAQQQVMAVSIKTTSVAAYPAMITDIPKTAAALSEELRVSRKTILRSLKSGRSFVWVKRQATPKQTDALRRSGLKGIDFIPEHSRFYPNTTVAGQVLGFTGIDGHGLEGLEFFYDKDLKGPEQKVRVHKDALGRGFKTDTGSNIHQAGNSLVLTIDRHIQYIAEDALVEAVTAHQARSGMAMVMHPQTGAVLAMAHYPLFNPNNFRKFDRSAWRNRAITDAFEPGSTMKIFSAAAALERGSLTSSSLFFCENGKYIVGGHTVNDTKPHGWLSLQQIVKLSSNIGVVKIAEKIGRQTLHDQLKLFGFGDRTLIDCPGESAGSLAHFKRWTSVDTGAISFGQGVAVTALQLVAATAALANDGMLMQPYIVQAVTDASGRPVRTVEPKPVRQVVSARTAHTVRRIMRTVITSGGTGTQAQLEGYDVAGKTGTAQKIDSNGHYTNDRYVSSFIGFAPAYRPALVVLVLVDEPKKTHYGGLVAAPAFRKIVKETLSYLNVPPAGDPDHLQVSRNHRISG
jgi:cell division protein FtsI (penicillin-binding protein 3)